MPFAFDFGDGDVIEWHRTGGGVRSERVTDYAPSLYVAGPPDRRSGLADTLAADPRVVGVGTERKYASLRADDREPVLRVDVDRTDAVRPLARAIRHRYADDAYAPGTVRLYDVDLAPGFRYCVDTGTSPVPDRDLRTLRLSIDDRALAEDDVTALAVDGDDAGETTDAVLGTVADRLAAVDPDVLILSHGDLVPLLYDAADGCGRADFDLGRRPGYEQLAGANTYESYGQVGHSPARYTVPGRAIVDTSNSFLWAESSLAGLLDLVERSWRPLQETAWGSIGTILTSIEIREARSRDVPAPWNKWEPEAFKSVPTLHDADRGGFTFAPEVGLHEDVHEIDFASLYPRIMCEYNLSPETVDCDCHDGDDVPGLGYSVCEASGFLGDVLRPLIEDRAALKERIGATDDPDERRRLRQRSGAIKWILVSCFGYQGYRNAKFGRIECHEAINAVAREILLDAKERLEAGGWRVVHGIVDSLWVTPVGDDPEPLDRIVADVSDDAGIPLEEEGRFEWVAFVPKRDSRAGALTKYFGKRAAPAAGEDEYKCRGIELRQRSTPPFVADVQRALIDRIDGTRSPAAACDRLETAIDRLRAGTVDPAGLAITRRVSKRPGDYSNETRTVAALRRAEDLGLAVHPGQSVEYVVIDDDARTCERVRLASESPEGYDPEFYRTLLVRAAESVLAPMGWDRDRIERTLSETATARLSAFGGDR